MTVHGAKGLEAPVVILPDTTGRAPEPRPPLLPTDEGGLVFAPRGGADTPESKAARDRLKEKQAQEGLRLLYVALTRARDRLIVCGRLPAIAKAPAQDSWYARVQAGFGASTIVDGVRSVVDGDLQLARFGPDPQTLFALEPTDEPPAPDPAWLTALAAAEPGMAALASPSRQAERQRGPAPSPLAAAGGLGRFRRGELIHRLLQLLPDLPEGDAGPGRRRPPGPRARRLPRTAARDGRRGAGRADRSRASPRCGARAAARRWRWRAARPSCRRGCTSPAGSTGWWSRHSACWWVDFKTNRPSPDRIEGADPAYLMQMALYVAVLREVFPGRRVEAALGVDRRAETDGGARKRRGPGAGARPALRLIARATGLTSLCDTAAHVRAGRLEFSAMATVKVDDNTFEAKVLGADRPGAGRLLGRVVRPLQADCPPRSTRSARNWPTS